MPDPTVPDPTVPDPTDPVSTVPGLTVSSAPVVRMVAADLDGTLLSRHTVVSAATGAVLRELVARGVDVVAATGRGHASAIERLAPVGAFRHAVFSNGAVVWDLTRDEAMRWCAFDTFELDAVVGWIERELPGCALAWETRDGFIHDAAWGLLRPESDGNLSETGPGAGVDVTKILVAHPGLDLGELLEIGRSLGIGATMTSSGAPFVEIMPPGVDKSTGLAWLCGELDIDASTVVAFGDQLNDLAMLAWAGRGVAMANAAVEVLDIADDVAGHHDEDGVGTYLATLFGIGLDGGPDPAATAAE